MSSDTEDGQDPDREHQGADVSVGKNKDAGIAIELTPGQIDHVVLGATGAGSMSVLLSGKIDVQEIFLRRAELMGDPSISRSLLRALMILAVLHPGESYMGVVEIASKLDLSPSTAHRYLTTLLIVGLVERNESTRKYRLAR
jgi:DNA-binding transcriptional ArsR family regulator